MRSENNESYFKAGQSVNLFRGNLEFLGKGKIRRVLNEGKAYVVIIDGLSMIVDALIVLPNGIALPDDMVVWLMDQKQKFSS